MPSLSETLVKMSPIKGEYYLVEREKIEDLYRNAGYNDEDTIPNYLTIDGKECLFTENFLEKDNKEYEIVIVANGFSWDDLIIYDEDE